MDYSPPGSSVHGISQARILEWIAISFPRRSSWPRDWTHMSCLPCGFFTVAQSREPKYSIQTSYFFFSDWYLLLLVVLLELAHCPLILSSYLLTVMGQTARAAAPRSPYNLGALTHWPIPKGTHRWRGLRWGPAPGKTLPQLVNPPPQAWPHPILTTSY